MTEHTPEEYAAALATADQAQAAIATLTDAQRLQTLCTLTMHMAQIIQGIDVETLSFENAVAVCSLALQAALLNECVDQIHNPAGVRLKYPPAVQQIISQIVSMG